MKCLIMSIFLILLSNLTEAKHKSYGGKYARDGQFPYIALFFYGRMENCGASIIHERWALTAAHCINEYEPNPLITVGTVKNFGSGKTYKVEQMYAHPNFTKVPSTVDGEHYVYGVNDIGLLRLASNVSFNDKVQPIVLATDENKFYGNSTATMSGWGSEHAFDFIRKSLRYINVRVMTSNECRKVYTFIDKQICTSTKEKQGACRGDSGSPVVVDGVQIGVVSGGDPYCRMNLPDLDIKVASFVPWIKEVMSQYGDVLPD